jgi:3-dehydroquinate dehydratase-1
MNIDFIGNVSIGDTPRIVAVIAGTIDQFTTLAAKAAEGKADILEFRADFCHGMELKAIKALLVDVKRIANLPILLTIRQFPEGGYFAGTEAERLDLFKGLLSEVDAVDIELYAKAIRDELITAAHAAGKFVVLSYHNFKHTPRLSKINEIVEDAMCFNGDIVKIAVMALNENDVNILSRFTATFDKNILLTTISMGEAGTVSRVLNPFLGSCFTYGFVGEAPTTPGQIEVNQLRRLIDAFPGQRITDVQEAEDLVHTAFNGCCMPTPVCV